MFSLNSSGLRGSYYVNGVLNSTQTGKIPVLNVINSNSTKTNCQISGGSDFSLLDIGDAFKITGGSVPDNGAINCTSGSINVTKTGNATYSSGVWNTTSTGDTITVTATSAAKGSWTSETKAATAAISVDNDGDATLSSAGGLILTVTATAGTGQQQENETRIYLVVPKPVS